MPDNNDLSERELEILRLVATGASNKQIAQQLFISTNTVKVHLKNIFSKIGVASRTEAAMYAVQSKLINDVLPSPDLLENNVNMDNVPQGIPWSGLGRFLSYPQSYRKALGLALLVFILMAIAVATVIPMLRIDNEGNSSTPGLTEATTEDNKWKSRSSMAIPRYGFGLVAYENMIYVLGGNTREGVTNSVERYDPDTDEWEILASKPTPVGNVSAVVIGGKIYVPGGRLESGDVTSILEIYDIQTNRWVRGQNLPHPTSAYGLTAYEGRIYLFGGWDGLHYLDKSVSFDPAEDEWSTLPPMPTERGYQGCAIAGGRIYIIGGRNLIGDLKVNEEFSPDAKSPENYWSNASPMPITRSGIGIINVADYIFVFGGTTEDKSPLMVYRPASDTWSISQTVFSPLSTDLGLVQVEALIFAVGGRIEGRALAINQSFQAIYSVSIPLVR